MPNFHSSQHTANLASKTIQDQECCPVKPTVCKNDCSGALRNLPVITKDVEQNSLALTRSNQIKIKNYKKKK